MNTHYVLPVSFAIAVHGALLFGFTRHPRPLKFSETTVPDQIFEVALEEAEPVVHASEFDDPPARTPPPAPQPDRGPELPALEPDVKRFVIDRVPILDVSGTDTRILPHVAFDRVNTDGTGPWRKMIALSGELDNSPRVRFQVSPTYPFEAKRTGLHGEVHVEFVVDERGHVFDPRVVRSSDRAFEEATLRAVSRWRFEPGRRHGKVVRFRMVVPVLFNLNEGS